MRRRSADQQIRNRKASLVVYALDVGDFIWPALYVQDATIQRLAKLCEARPRGMMQIRDELSGLFASMLRQPGARPFYLEGLERSATRRRTDEFLGDLVARARELVVLPSRICPYSSWLML
jgi:hypothetical protein